MSPCLFSLAAMFKGFGPPSGGDEQNRTVDPLLARQVLSQLSYTPVFGGALFAHLKVLQIFRSAETLKIKQRIVGSLTQFSLLTRVPSS